jgi:hypothetical protein
MHHLTPEQIERYASRSGSVDEILYAAQHFEVCSDCRDRAAAHVDSGDHEISHTRRERRVSGARPALQAMARRQVGGRPLLIWIILAAAILVLLMLIVARR